MQKTRHVWMPNGRSLCDRRVRPQRPCDKQEAVDAVQEWLDAPSCGSCIVLVDGLRQQAAIMLHNANGILPKTVVASVLELDETVWPEFGAWNIDELRDGTWDRAITPKITEEWAQQEGAKEIQQQLDALKNIRATDD